MARKDKKHLGLEEYGETASPFAVSLTVVR